MLKASEGVARFSPDRNQAIDCEIARGSRHSIVEADRRQAVVWFVTPVCGALTICEWLVEPEAYGGRSTGECRQE